MPRNETEIHLEVVIEYDQFFAGRELSEIIEVIDEAVWDSYTDEFLPMPRSYRYLFNYASGQAPSLVCIKEVRKGSAILGIILGSAAYGYCERRFRSAWRKARVDREMRRLTDLLLSNVENLIGIVNDHLEEYNNYLKEKRSNIRSVKVRKGNDDVPK